MRRLLVPAFTLILGGAALWPGAISARAAGGLTITGRTITDALVTDSQGKADFCAAPAAKTTFSTTDVAAGIWFTFDQGQRGDVLAIEWIHPSGAIDTQRIATNHRSGLIGDGDVRSAATRPATLMNVLSFDPGHCEEIGGPSIGDRALTKTDANV
jgi:hypothetical protein